MILLDKKVESQRLQPLFWCWDSIIQVIQDLEFTCVDVYSLGEEARVLVSKAVVMSESKKNKDKDGGMLALLSVGTKMADSLSLMDIRYHMPRPHGFCTFGSWLS